MRLMATSPLPAGWFCAVFASSRLDMLRKSEGAHCSLLHSLRIASLVKVTRCEMLASR